MSRHILKWIGLIVIFAELAYANPIQRRVKRGEEPTKWTGYTQCSEDSYVSGLSLIFKDENSIIPRPRRNSEAKVPTLAYGVNISCTFANPRDGVYFIENIPLRDNGSTAAFKGELDSKYDCLSPLEDYEIDDEYRIFGFAVGVEKHFSEPLSSSGAKSYSVGTKSVLSLGLYCNHENKISRRQPFTPNYAVRGEQHRWSNPELCPWGQYICAVNLHYDSATFSLFDVKRKCCPHFRENIGWRNYRGATNGKVLQSIPILNGTEMDKLMRFRTEFQYIDELDDPYYYQWEFCPVETYITGLQGHFANRQFRPFCSDISKPKPRSRTYLQMPFPLVKGDVWDMEDQLGKPVECEGVVIGFQALYEENTKQIQGLRFICSYVPEGGDPNDLRYVKVILPPLEIPEGNAIYTWGQVDMCQRQQALCGFKAKAATDRGFPLKTEHIKAKCCDVPSIAEICAPSDAYELVVECDNRQAQADTRCQYTLSEGMRISHSSVQTYKASEDLREGLSLERSVSDINTKRFTVESSTSNSKSDSNGSSASGSVNTAISISNTENQGSSSSNTDGRTNNRGSSTSKGSNWGHSTSVGRDTSVSNGNSQTFSNTLGFGAGGSSSRTSGESANFLRTRSDGSSFSDSASDTVGSSSGSMSSSTAGSSRSRSSGESSSDSVSSSNTKGSSSSRGSSTSSTTGGSMSIGSEVTASASVNVGFMGIGASASLSATVRENVEVNYSQSKGTTSEESVHDSNTSGRESTKSTNSQNTDESSSSDTRQTNSEQTKSKSSTSGKEVSSTNSLATGGDRNSQKGTATTFDKTSQSMLGGGSETTSAINDRRNTDVNSGSNNQITSDSSSSLSSQQSWDNSKSKARTNGREESSSSSHGRTKERSESKTNSKSTSGTAENSRTIGGSRGRTKDRSFTTGYDWTKTSEHTWSQDRSYMVSMEVPPGYRTRLYQVVGYCANFQVRTNNFRRVDTVVKVPEPGPEQHIETVTETEEGDPT